MPLPAWWRLDPCAPFRLGPRLLPGRVWTASGCFGYGLDGHDIEGLLHCFEWAKQANSERSMPAVIVANTIKGRGVSFMEGLAGWHGKAPSPDQTKQKSPHPGWAVGPRSTMVGSCQSAGAAPGR